MLVQWAYRFVIQHQRAKAITNLKHQKEAAKLPVRFKRKRPYFKAFYSSKTYDRLREMRLSWKGKILKLSDHKRLN